jgi:hypothetical protein
MSFKDNKALWLCAIVAFLAVIALIWILMSGGPRTLVILFPEVGDLKREDPVIWHGYAIGRVEAIDPLVENQVGVTIRINEDYSSKLTRGSRFTLKRAALFGLVGSNAIEVETPSESGFPYLEGEKVQGFAQPNPTVVEEGKRVAADYWQEIKKQASLLTEEYQRSPLSKEVQEALAELKGLAQKGYEQAQDGIDKFRGDHQKEIEAVTQKLEQARDWMRKKGDEAGARRLQEEIDRLLKK